MSAFQTYLWRCDTFCLLLTGNLMHRTQSDPNGHDQHGLMVCMLVLTLSAPL